MVWFKDEIARHQNPNRKARTDGDGRLDVQGAPDDLLADLVEALRGALANGLGEIVLAVASSGLCANAEDSGERRSLEQRAPMLVHLVLQARIAFGVGAGLAFQHDRAAVGQNEPGPDQQGPRLAECDLGVVLAD